jgi:hypothetical protein
VFNTLSQNWPVASRGMKKSQKKRCFIGGFNKLFKKALA